MTPFTYTPYNAVIANTSPFNSTYLSLQNEINATFSTAVTIFIFLAVIWGVYFMCKMISYIIYSMDIPSKQKSCIGKDDEIKDKVVLKDPTLPNIILKGKDK